MATHRRKLIVRLLLAFTVAALVGVTVVFALDRRVTQSYDARKYLKPEFLQLAMDKGEVAEPERYRVALVFGAGVWRDGAPSPVLYDRIATAVWLYRTGTVNKLLLSGDNRFVGYNEPAVMRETALKMGVADADLVLDFAGRRTYDSCYRAREIFGVDHAVLVTQEFHLARALYVCNELGVESVGVRADMQSYGERSRAWWEVREVLARSSAWLDVNVLRPTPILGEREPVNLAVAKLRR